MKHLFFFLFSTILMAQNVALMEFKSNIKDPKNTTSNLVVFDGRSNKSLGTVNIKGVPTEIKFKNDLVKDFTEWFKKYNKKGGTNDIALLVEKMEIKQDSVDSKSFHVYVNGSTFYKRNGNYFFINRMFGKDKVKIWDVSTNTKNITSAYDKLAAQLLLNSYGKMAISKPIPEENLLNYEDVLKSSFQSLSLKLKDGVYKDYMSFINQRPCSAEVKLNNKNEIKSITEGGLKANDLDYFAVVHNGVPYRVIEVGFKKMMMDDTGPHIIAYDYEIKSTVSTATYGAIGFGMIGAVVGAVVDDLDRTYNNKGLQKFYIDLLTGEYIPK